MCKKQSGLPLYQATRRACQEIQQLAAHLSRRGDTQPGVRLEVADGNDQLRNHLVVAAIIIITIVSNISIH